MHVAPTAPCSIEYVSSSKAAESFHRHVGVVRVISCRGLFQTTGALISFRGVPIISGTNAILCLPFMPNGKVIAIAGGAGGIGGEVSSRLASEGTCVVIADVNAAHADAKAAVIVAAGGDAIGIRCDITSPDECEAVARIAIERYGRIDGLVNCAGISEPHDSLSLPPASWSRMIDVQLNGTFYFAQACARRMIDSGGVIVFITSTNAEAAFPRRAAYCSAKAGVAMLTKVLAIEWAERGIRVNAVGPAYVATEMTQRNIVAGNVNEGQIRARIPLGRLAQPGDVADAVSFLLSDKSSFITGHSLYVDGGWLAYGYF